MPRKKQRRMWGCFQECWGNDPISDPNLRRNSVCGEGVRKDPSCKRPAEHVSRKRKKHDKFVAVCVFVSFLDRKWRIFDEKKVFVKFVHKQLPHFRPLSLKWSHLVGNWRKDNHSGRYTRNQNDEFIRSNILLTNISRTWRHQPDKYHIDVWLNCNCFIEGSAMQWIQINNPL